MRLCQTTAPAYQNEATAAGISRSILPSTCRMLSGLVHGPGHRVARSEDWAATTPRCAVRMHLLLLYPLVCPPCLLTCRVSDPQRALTTQALISSLSLSLSLSLSRSLPAPSSAYPPDAVGHDPRTEPQRWRRAQSSSWRTEPQRPLSGTIRGLRHNDTTGCLPIRSPASSHVSPSGSVRATRCVNITKIDHYYHYAFSPSSTPLLPLPRPQPLTTACIARMLNKI